MEEPINSSLGKRFCSIRFYALRKAFCPLKRFIVLKQQHNAGYNNRKFKRQETIGISNITDRCTNRLLFNRRPNR